MAANEKNTLSEILRTYDLEELILAFCLSMLVGLLIGILIYIFLTWMTRRRASVSITTCPKRWSRASRSCNLHGQLGLYRNNGVNLSSESSGRAVLNLHRQTSVDPNELLGHSPSFQASTFRPVKKGSNGTENDNETELLHSSSGDNSTVTDHCNTGESESFWLGKGTLRGFLPTQTPPPAYDSVIHTFQESHT